MDANQLLMTSIRKTWGNTIATACSASSVPPAFLAALIAGETGGHNDSRRFEKGVLAAIWEVLLGRKTAYGSISHSDLVGYVSGVSNPITVPQSLPADAFQRVDALSTSWGLTQIMGYHALEFRITMDALRDPPQHLVLSTKILAQFAQRFQLDLAADYPPLFACWNTGGPDPTKTFDPKYCANGVERMKIYADILANETDPGT